ncbi:zinc ribbon domain-containing protein [Ruminiclostridium cellulolyticum]|uniref:Putative zinc-ribbon domain-containing protein n=1 Tax=Ruminiclostridium cellulolyticum (strain ATCC 35319 / DSM 5812 / JCM 6584 / H10) TaxID=394503 RepID=B8I4M5_RUMCH|nr:zinc ribbon domain-containing protein [Ruminiclostridium cellulolyticum]ACL76529.1 hypothetical protein Ccel_2187 [Ruminiclostridium cellulolyticum H10]
MEFLIPLSLCVVALFILYLVIKSAIDGSETAKEIRQIRMILQKQYGKALKQIKQTDNDYEVMDIPYYTCPACGANVKPENNTCPSCGLNLNGKNE